MLLIAEFFHRAVISRLAAGEQRGGKHYRRATNFAPKTGRFPRLPGLVKRIIQIASRT